MTHTGGLILLERTFTNAPGFQDYLTRFYTRKSGPFRWYVYCQDRFENKERTAAGPFRSWRTAERTAGLLTQYYRNGFDQCATGRWARGGGRYS